MPTDDTVISVKNLTKKFRVFGHPGDRIKQALTFGRVRFHREFTALQDVSFEVKKGETVGIIGRNGSGKSTLLQLICGILKPTSGTTLVNGRVSALLELGAGFNPEFTGRENVYFHGALMGITRARMDERFDDITSFADIGEFIDQPVRTYSSGMFVRLAFAVSIHVDPDILVVDEALAVGDTRFQARCFERIESIRRRGGTILIVTHAIEQVAHFCDRALLLDHGKLIEDGDATQTLSRYLALFDGSTQDTESTKQVVSIKDDHFRAHPGYNSDERRWGDNAATITEINITQDGIENPKTVAPGHVIEVKLRIDFHTDVQRPIYGFAIKSPVGALILNTNSRQLLVSDDCPDQRAGDRVLITLVFEPFLDCGKYLLSFGIVSESNFGIVPHDRRYDAISMQVAHPYSLTGDVALNPRFRLTGMS